MQSVDLHGIKHVEVSDIIIECCMTYDIPFIVITGQSPEMKRIVQRVANDYNLKVRDSVINPGRVVVG